MTEETTSTVKLTAEQKLRQKAEKLYARIQADTAEYSAIIAELQALTAVATVAQGNIVDATVGKGAKAVSITGALVLGVQDTETGKQIKVQVGEGFETQVYVLTPAQVTKVHDNKPAEAADLTDY